MSENKKAILKRDRRLVLRMRKGEQSAFREIFDYYHPILLRFLNRYPSLTRDDMYDVMQQAFIKAFDSLNSLKDERHFGTWLLKIARNAVVSLIRKEVKEREDLISVMVDQTGRSKEDPFVREQIFKALEKALQDVADPLAKKIVDFYYGPVQMTTKQISEKLGIPKGTVTSKLQRLRQRLQSKLAELTLEYDLPWSPSQDHVVEPDEESST
jgi:RNA polymerase sigma-70 factor (ECF subfamily)